MAIGVVGHTHCPSDTKHGAGQNTGVGDVSGVVGGSVVVCD